MTELQLHRAVAADGSAQICLDTLPPSVNAAHVMRQRGPGGRKFIGKSDAYTDWIEAAAWLVKSQRHGVEFDAPVSVRIDARRPTDRRSRLDLDNIVKPAIDALQKGGLLTNDRLVERIHVEWSQPNVAMIINVEPIPPGRVAVAVRAG